MLVLLRAIVHFVIIVENYEGEAIWNA